jgi:serine/threonine protein phosphatase PrpC
MHRGQCTTQQDAIHVAGTTYQRSNLLPTQTEVYSDALFAVADGVAASPTAARASRLALRTLADLVGKHADWSYDGLIGARHVRATQQALCDALVNKRLAVGASTSMVAAQIRGHQLAVVNSGDSRAYRLCANHGIERLSHDHSERQRLVASGEMQEGRSYASIYDALSDCLIADSAARDFAVHRTTAELKSGDRLLLCSDGVHDSFANQRWLEQVCAADCLLDAAWQIRDQVIAADASDNFSFILIALEERP